MSVAGRGRFRRTLSSWRVLARIAYRDPEHVAERLALYGAGNLGEPSGPTINCRDEPRNA